MKNTPQKKTDDRFDFSHLPDAKRCDRLYYAIILTAVVMFSVQFLFNQIFEKECGSSKKATGIFSLGYSMSGLISLIIINGFKWEFTPFSALMALLTAVNGLLYTLCSLKAFGRINLSLYSVFAMLGGMLLPFLCGIVFFGEKLTLGSIACVILTSSALTLTVKRGKSADKKYFVYYIGIFLLNGMSGVLSKLFSSLDFPKTSEAGFSVLTAVAAVVLSGIMLIFSGKEKINLNFKSIGGMLGYGILNRVANLLLLIALVHVSASAQYPMVTGGVMIFSTVISFFTGQKPSGREIAAVVLSFIGVTVLVLI